MFANVENMKSADYKEQNYQFKTKVNMKTKNSILAATKAFFILLVSCCLFSCNQYIPREKLDGKILFDENGKKIKLEWQSGWGESWRFLEEVTVISEKDTIKEWRYIK